MRARKGRSVERKKWKKRGMNSKLSHGCLFTRETWVFLSRGEAEGKNQVEGAIKNISDIICFLPRREKCEFSWFHHFSEKSFLREREKNELLTSRGKISQEEGGGEEERERERERKKEKYQRKRRTRKGKDERTKRTCPPVHSESEQRYRRERKARRKRERKRQKRKREQRSTREKNTNKKGTKEGHCDRAYLSTSPSWIVVEKHPRDWDQSELKRNKSRRKGRRETNKSANIHEQTQQSWDRGKWEEPITENHNESQTERAQGANDRD